MWRNFRFLHICHVEKFEITQHVEKCQISPHLSCGKIGNYSECGEISDLSTSVTRRNLRLLHMWKSLDFSTSVMWIFLNYSTWWEMSDFSTSVMWRNLKFLHMWRHFWFLHICPSYKFEISQNDKFFSTYLICDICDKSQVWETALPIFSKSPNHVQTSLRDVCLLQYGYLLVNILRADGLSWSDFISTLNTCWSQTSSKTSLFPPLWSHHYYFSIKKCVVH